jgi:hypothetical protein
VADACRTGPATDIIFGLALGYKSTIIPCFVIAATIYVANSLAGALLTLWAWLQAGVVSKYAAASKCHCQSLAAVSAATGRTLQPVVCVCFLQQHRRGERRTQGPDSSTVELVRPCES